jgi:tetratricopeptide (TPR) repeat protein
MGEIMKLAIHLCRYTRVIALFCLSSIFALSLSALATDLAYSQAHENELNTTQNTNGLPPKDADLNEIRLSTRDLYDRLAAQEKRLELAIEIKNDQLDSIYNFLQLFAMISGLVVVYLAVRDAMHRKRETQTQERINEGLDSVNKVIGTVNETMEFRLKQEQTVVKTLESIGKLENTIARFEQAERSRYDEAIATAKEFSKYSRMEFATLLDEARLAGQNLRHDAHNMKRYLDTVSDYLDKGRLYYVCGVLSYYENDIHDAKHYLDLSANTRAGDHEAELKANSDYRARIAFTHFFRALIEKNWGSTLDALHEVDECIHARKLDSEDFLTPVTQLEILSYSAGKEHECLDKINYQIKTIKEVQEKKDLDQNQARLYTRLLLIQGNINFILKNYKEALQVYENAAATDPHNYYVYTSQAQCCEYLQLADEATIKYKKALSLIEQSRDIERKREIITRAVIIVLANQCAYRSGNLESAILYAKEAKSLLSRELTLNGLEPHFFSPNTKRLVSARDLLSECETS